MGVQPLDFKTRCSVRVVCVASYESVYRPSLHIEKRKSVDILKMYMKK